MSALNDIAIYLSMGDFGKAIDVIDRCFVNLRKIEAIPQNLDSIASVRQFPEVVIWNERHV